MGYHIDENSNYHEGDMLAGDQEVTRRPDQLHSWISGEWVVAHPTNSQLQDKIDGLEKACMIPRITREFMLAQSALTAQLAGVSEPELYAANIGYRKLKDLDATITSLRAEMG